MVRDLLPPRPDRYGRIARVASISEDSAHTKLNAVVTP